MLNNVNAYSLAMNYLSVGNHRRNCFKSGRMLCSHCHGHAHQQQCHNFQLCELGEVGTSNFRCLYTWNKVIFLCVRPYPGMNSQLAEQRTASAFDWHSFNGEGILAMHAVTRH
jgi:hypothetical protein